MINNTAFRRGLKIQLIGLAFCVLVSCFMGWTTILFFQAPVDSLYYYECKMPENSISVIEEVTFDAVNSEIQGNRFRTLAADAQLIIQFTEGKAYEIQTFSMILSEAFPYDVSCALFYPDDNGQFDKDYMVDYRLPQGERQLFINIPKGTYSSLRLDIDNDYEIKDIIISDRLAAGPYSLGDNLTLKQVALCSVLLMVLFEVLLFMWICCHKKSNSFPALLRKIRKESIVLLIFVILSFSVTGLFIFLFHPLLPWFWAIMLPCMSILMGYQIRKLFSKNIVFSSKKDVLLRGVPYWICISLFCVLLIFKWSETAKSVPDVKNSAEMSFIYCFALCETVLLSLLYYRYLLGEKGNRESYLGVFTLVTLVLSFAYMLVFLPFISPDEMVHYSSAYRFSNLFMGKIGLLGDKRLLMRMEDYTFLCSGGKKLDLQYYLRTLGGIQLFAEKSGYIIIDSAIPTNAPFCYCFSALGIALGRLLNLSGSVTFYLGRMGNLLFFVLSMRYVMKKIPYGQAALFSISVFPMMLQLESSYSYDIVTYCYVAFFFMQVMYIAYSDCSISPKEVALCAFFAALMAPSKVVFLPLLFIVFVIPKNRFGKDCENSMKIKGFIIFSGIMSLIAVYMVIGAFGINSSVGQMVENNKSVHMLAWAHEEGITVSWIMGHIFETVLIYIRTLVERSNTYFFELFGSHLGWLDVNVPYINLAICFAVFLLSVNIRGDRMEGHQPGIIEKMWIILMCIASAAATMLVLMLDWTPLSYNIIHGIQGRYFLPLMISMIFVLKNKNIQISKIISKYVVLVMTGLNIWVCVYIYSQAVLA